MPPARHWRRRLLVLSLFVVPAMLMMPASLHAQTPSSFVKVRDTFVRETEYLKDHVPDYAPPGLRWTDLGGRPLARLKEGQAVVNPITQPEAAVVDVGLSDVTVTVDVVGKEGGVVLRATDARNYLMVLVDAEHGPVLYRYQNGHAGSPLAVGSLSFDDEWEVRHLEVRAKGDRIAVYLDHGTSPAIETRVAFQQTATRHGIRWPNDNITFDNFELGSSDELPPWWSKGCVSSLTPSAMTVPFESETEEVITGALRVTAPAGCYWGATTRDFLHLTGGGAGSGDGVITFRVDSHSGGLPRVASIKVGGLTTTVTQTASPCEITFSPESSPNHAHYRDATAGEFRVINPNSCSWSVSAVPAWMIIHEGASGVGSGTVRYELSENDSGADRVAELIIDSRPYRIIQRGVGSSGGPTGPGPAGPGPGVPGGGGRKPAPDGSCAPLSLPGIECWNVFSADVTIRRYATTADDEPVAALMQPIRYRWERWLRNSVWHTGVTIEAAPDGLITSGLSGSSLDLTGTRIEDDGTQVRVYAPDGSPLEFPTESLLGSLGLSAVAGVGDAPENLPPASRPGADVVPRWIENYVFTTANRDARLAALRERFGPPSGSVRGLSRYVAFRGERAQEVLLEPAGAVIREANVIEAGTPILRTIRSYQSGVGDSLVLQALHAEHLVSAETGERARIDIEFNNVRVEQGR